MANANAGDAAELKPSTLVKIFYGFGDMAQAGGFATAIGFVFFYYTAVLGLSGGVVGTALAVSLAFDAVVDPLIGSWSDNIKSKLGRRLPLMILAAPLITVSMGLLFSPPAGLSDQGLFVWLAVMSVAARTFISLFNVPYIALGAEMATDYAERSSIVAVRSVAGIMSGFVVNTLAYVVFFAGKGGLQRHDNYPAFGWTVAGLLLVTMTICCLGVRRYAAKLPQPEQVTQSIWLRLPGEMAEIFRNRSFRLLFMSAILAFTAGGLAATLNSHAYVFVWRLRTETIQYLTYSYLAGVLLGVITAPLLQRFLEKKNVVIVGIAIIAACWGILPSLRAAGLFTPTGDAALPALALNLVVTGLGLGFAAIAYPSMMADAADEHEYLFGRRREGLYFSGLGFAGKAASGLGVLVAGIALDLIHFPKDIGKQVGAVLAPDVQFHLILAWGPGAAAFAFLSLVVFFPYAISRKRHAEIAAGLKERRG